MNDEKAAVKLSTRSWHYKLIKFILGSAAPTPNNMYNLCPYFWLLIFSILVTPVWGPLKLIFNGLAKVMGVIDEFIAKTWITPACISYEEKLSDLDLYQIMQWGKKIKRMYASFNDIDNYYTSNRKEAAYKIWEKRYEKKVMINENPNYHYGTYTKDFLKWINEQEKAYDELFKADMIKKQNKVQYEEKLKEVRSVLDNWFNGLRESMRSWNNIIKWTKRIVGLIVTAILFVATYFIVNFLGRGILWLIEHWDWYIVGIGGLVLAGFVAGVGLVSLFRIWILYVQEKGMTLWYIKAIYWPLYICVWWPIKIVFYYLLWQLLALNLWYFIKKGAQLIWGSFLGFLGIFGEYFGASYTDYCPGIEWDEENK
ncbi:MAG: hypothetical protein ACTSW3_03665 [Promethearchaeota archaeon]